MERRNLIGVLDRMKILVYIILLIFSMVLMVVPVSAEVGKASYYWQPQRVASGGWFNPRALTAAHKTLKFGTRVRVTNLRNKRSVIVVINDRGPYIKGRIIDLSKAAAEKIGMIKSGVVNVSITKL